MEPTRFLFILLTILCTFCECYKILAVFPMPFFSHYILGSKLLKELAKRGHQVTAISPYPQKTPIENFTDISIESMVGIMNERKGHLYSLDSQTIIGKVQFFMDMGCFVTEEALKHEEIQKLLHSNEHYDVVVLPQFLHEALMAIPHHFKTPTILMSTMPLFSWAKFLHAFPTMPSYIPHSLMSFTGRMNFWQRVMNTIYDAYSIMYHQYITLPKHKEMVQKYVPGSPDLYDFLHNVSIILLNYHVSVYDAMPRPPNHIEIGGFHVEPPKPLPQDLQQFLDQAKEGVILFSMGSNLKSADLPSHTRDDILKTFSRLKQKVLWKWETEEMPKKPKNVKLMKWLPQSDILAHPNVKLFLTHGGLLSTMEAIHRGVPVVGIPIFADQKMNMALAVSNGYGLTVPLKELTEETLSWAINEVLNNPKYEKEIKRRSLIMKDRPRPPVEDAIYWIEYVVRHQGAPQLKYPGADLTWFQRNIYDVIAFLILTATVVFLLCYKMFRNILKMFAPRKEKIKTN